MSDVLIFGHKNPDTDSICSAISYSYLKNKIDDKNYIPCRIGEINEETNFVLNYFNVKKPNFIEDVGVQVKDLDMSNIQGVDENISLKNAWNIMEVNVKSTLPITDKADKLIGIITVEDIATSYMEIFENDILSVAKTPFKNILETIEAVSLTEITDEIFTRGKVVIAAANPELMEEYIEKDDLVITGNKYEMQLCAIEMGASCIVVCEGTPISKTIQNIAKNKGTHIFSTKFDTFTVARSIHQSIPVKHFMKTSNLTTFSPDNFVDNIKDTITKNKYRDFPIVDENNKYLGMISRRNLISPRRKQVILVDHNELSQAVKNIKDANILEIIDHHRIGTLETNSPVYFRNQPVGCTATIIYQIFRENNVDIPKDIACLLCSAIISDTLLFRSPTCTIVDETVAKELSKIAEIDLEKYAKEMFKAGSNIAHKEVSEIFYQDFKKFTIQNVNFGVAQINSMNKEDEKIIIEKILPYLHLVKKEHNLNMVFFMLTNILEKTTTLLHIGEDSEKLVYSAFGVETKKDIAVLKDVVSRKKQLIPQFAISLQGE